MKTFEQEYEELWTWLRLKDAEHLEASRKEHPLVMDGEADRQQAQNVREFNSRLLQLKSKHGVK